MSSQSNASGRIWFNTSNPTNNEPDVEKGNFFMNTANNLVFMCQDDTPSAQVWQQYMSSSSLSQSSASRSLNSAFRISTTRWSMVSYAVNILSTASLSGGQTGAVILEIASDSGFTTNVQELGRMENGNTVSLAIALTATQTITSSISGMVPVGYYVRLRTSNILGSPSYAYRSGQEVLL